ncbi:MAG: hypothetical protein CSYNP_01050 [Syntrophus sp. SKADARSKE-3]|nr:hypothetical protein [Syntrophus sp. SKADARSKE-3]
MLLLQVIEKLNFVQAVQKFVPDLIRDVQMQGAQKLRNEASGTCSGSPKGSERVPGKAVTRLAAQLSRRRPRESVGWTFFNSLLEVSFVLYCSLSQIATTNPNSVIFPCTLMYFVAFVASIFTVSRKHPPAS